ncbi:MAG: response regulator transcription factor [Luteolibacter sp.]
MKKIFLVDDHPMLRAGLARLIEEKPGCHVCGEAETAAEAFEAIPALQPDMVMMDISLPDKNGLELIKDLNSITSRIPILVFSMHDEMLYAERVIRAGAKGYLMKGVATEKLNAAIDCVLGGGLYLSHNVSNHILNTLSAKRNDGKVGQVGIERLSDREIEIFELIGRGKSNTQIAEQLHISPRTVDAHRCNIKSKLALTDAPSLMREAVLWIELADRIPRGSGIAAG